MVPCYTFCSEKPLAPASYWQGSPDIPVYQEGCKNGYTAQELAEGYFLCRNQPLRIRSRKAFLIDLRFIALEDLTASVKFVRLTLTKNAIFGNLKITKRKRNEPHSRNSYYSIERNWVSADTSGSVPRGKQQIYDSRRLLRHVSTSTCATKDSFTDCLRASKDQRRILFDFVLPAPKNFMLFTRTDK